MRFFGAKGFVRFFFAAAVVICGIAGLTGCGKKTTYTEIKPDESASSDEKESDDKSAYDGTPWPAGAIYFDDFTASGLMTDRGWEDIKVIKDGAAVISSSALYLTGEDEYLDWTDYTVEAVFTLLEGPIPEGVKSSALALVGRTPGDGMSGYELGFVIYPNGDGYLRLYDRLNGKEVAKSEEITPEAQKTYTFRMTFSGRRIICSVDGRRYVDYTAGEDEQHGAGDGKNAKGTVGIRPVNGYGAALKSIAVYPPSEEDLK